MRFFFIAMLILSCVAGHAGIQFGRSVSARARQCRIRLAQYLSDVAPDALALVVRPNERALIEAWAGYRRRGGTISEAEVALTTDLYSRSWGIAEAVPVFDFAARALLANARTDSLLLCLLDRECAPETPARTPSIPEAETSLLFGRLPRGMPHEIGIWLAQFWKRAHHVALAELFARALRDAAPTEPLVRILSERGDLLWSVLKIAGDHEIEEGIHTMLGTETPPTYFRDLAWQRVTAVADIAGFASEQRITAEGIFDWRADAVARLRVALGLEAGLILD